MYIKVCNMSIWIFYVVGSLFSFLNQARASHRPARAWFLKIEPVRIVCICVYVCVCVSAPEAINN